MKFTKKEMIRSSGRAWSDVHTVAFSTEEGAFLRGQVTMAERRWRWTSGKRTAR